MQTFAQHVRQRAVVRAADVGDLHARGIGLRAGAHRTDQRNAAVEAALDERQLRREGVDRIHRIIVGRGVEQPVGLFVPDVFLDDGELQIGVDVAQPLGENFGLGASDRRMQSDQLPVDIGFGHTVGVGDREAARTGAIISAA